MDVAGVERLLRGLGLDVAAVEPVGAGAWSECFGYRSAGGDFVVRIGDHLDDFEKDRVAQVYAGRHLPIPEVLDIGDAPGGYYAISTRAPGTPLEGCTEAEWARLVDPVADALEAMRVAEPVGTGWGGWDGHGEASCGAWRDVLLAVDGDAPDIRTHGWRAKLGAHPSGESAFRWGYRLLDEVAGDDVPRSLVHGDMINGNVHVAGDVVTGVFDWGCSTYGDHLYELAWFEFWAPWHPNIDDGALGDAMEGRWRSIGYVPARRDERMLACHLHIGLDHLACNAHLGRWEELARVATRMRELRP